MSPNNGIILKGVLIPNLHNNRLASCFIINLDLLLHIGHYDKTIVFLPVFEAFAFILSKSFLHLINMITGFLLIVSFYYRFNCLDTFFE